MLLIFLTGLNNGLAQVSFDRITVEEGLSQGTVQCILQDSRGFMWLGTQDGLNKYDGYEFTVFQHRVGDSTSIAGNSVFSIVEDSQSNLWVGTTTEGISEYNRFSNTFITYAHSDTDSTSISSDNIIKLYISTHGERELLWVATAESGVNYLDLATRQIKRFNHRGMPRYVYNLVQLEEDKVLLAGYSGFYLYEAEKDSISPYPLPEPLKNSIHSAVLSLQYDEHKNLWIGTTREGLFRYNLDTGVISHWHQKGPKGKRLAEDIVVCLEKDAFGNMWGGCESQGIFKVEALTDDVSQYVNHPDDDVSISNNIIFSMFRDQSNLLWIGTENGLNKLNPSIQKFRQANSTGAVHNWLENENIWCFAERLKKELWVGTANGVYRIDQNGKILQHWTKENSPALHSNDVLTMTADSLGRMWIGTYQGLAYWDPGYPRRLQAYKPSVTDSVDWDYVSIMNLMVDPTDSTVLWIGRMYGLNRLNLETLKMVEFSDSVKVRPNPVNEYISCFTHDSTGDIYIGTDDLGIWIFDPVNDSFSVLNRENSKLSSNRINDITFTEDGTLWVGTYGGGLNRLKPGDLYFVHYLLKDGLPNTVIYGILEDESGSIWLSSNAGLSRMDLQKESFFNYDSRYGLQNDEFNQGAYYKSSTGKLYFGGVAGYNAFFADELTLNTYRPPLVITDFKLFNEAVPIGYDDILTVHINECQQIELKPEHHVFTLVFSALDYHIPERNQYAIRLLNFSDEWIQLGNRRVMTYSNLDPGEYVFQVKGSNDDGLWNENGKKLKIIVHAPLAETAWFQGVMLLSIVLLLAVGYRYRTRLLRVRAKELAMKVEERTADLVHFNEKLQEQIQERKKAEKAVRVSEERYRNFFEQSTEGIWRMEFDPPIPIDLPVDKQMELIYTSGYIAECNQAFSDMYRLPIDAMVGKSMADLHGGTDDPQNLEEQKIFITSDYRVADAETHEYDAEGNDIFILNNSFGVIHKGKLLRIWGTQRDITERKYIEQQIKASLKEKDVLLKEIHHRVKNNMQIISSLLQLQSRRVEDERVIRILNESQARVRSMALVHEMLYGSHRLSEIDFSQYTKRLVHSLYSVHGRMKHPVEFKYEMDTLLLSVDSAVPCGLVVNELITNILKHAFPDGWEGDRRVQVGLSIDTDENIHFYCEDSGKGLPDDFHIDSSHSLGVFLIRILVEEQLSGHLNFQNLDSGGCRVDINFPLHFKRK